LEDLLYKPKRALSDCFVSIFSVISKNEKNGESNKQTNNFYLSSPNAFSTRVVVVSLDEYVSFLTILFQVV
jgi:hypothetical protein